MRFTAMATALLAVVAVVGAGCSYRNETINRVVDPFWRKSDFNPDSSWYVRTTVTDAPPEHGWISIADGDWLMLERIRWEIGETQLLGWRDYPVVPGTELDQYPGADDIYKGQPVAVFAITDHFDIRQDFDPTTGELGNEIVENSDRLWFDRANMRVDWSHNLVGTYKFHIQLQQVFNTTAVLNHNPGDPDRSRFELDANGVLDYFEITNRTQIMPDIYAYFGWYGVPYMYDPAGAIVDMRTSFMRVPPSDYEPLPMPPSVVLEDADGNEVRDDNGFAVRIPINDRFGYFGTLGRNTFDENRGMVSSGQIFNASRFNIWQKHKNADGTIIPTDQRVAKPIIYYTNVDHPESLINGSERVAKEWNRAFRETIWQVQPAKFVGALDDTGIPTDVPPMFVLRRNDCNFANVSGILDTLPSKLQGQISKDSARESFNPEVVAFDGTLADAKGRFDNAQVLTSGTFTERQSEETQALSDLERVCTALEYYTQGDVTLGRPAATLEDGTVIDPFKYQRLGDTRYSLMNVIPGSFQAGWLGLGPPYADPITGETISGTANVSSTGIDRSASRAAQFVAALNGDLNGLDLGFGLDVQRYMKEKLLQTNHLTSLKPGNRAKESMAVYFDALKARGGGNVMQNAVGEVPPGRAESRMAQVAGTQFEQHLVTDDDLIAFGRVDPLAAAGSTLDDALLDAVSPVRGNNMLQQHIDRRKHIVQMGQRAMDPPEMIDNLLIGQAIAYKDLPYDELFQRLREDIYVAVMLHEVGHNTGLFHNMAGSSDALNFGKFFWEIQDLDADMDTAIDELTAQGGALAEQRIASLQACVQLVSEVGSDATTQLDPGALSMTTQDCLRQGEAMYSSIMDYHANWNSDFGGLGPYDLAATKFAYGQLLEVFDEGALKDRGADTRSIKRKIFLDGWQTIPTEIMNGTDSIQARSYQKMEWNTSSTRQAPLANEVPYKFGYGAQLSPDEKPFDFGPDFQTNARNELTRYFQHYFFSHFARDRLWDFDMVFSVASRDLTTMLDFTDKMQWFFFFEATDPEFKGSYAEEDMLGATITGLNFMGQVLGHPSNGQHVTALKTDVFGLLDESTDNRTISPSDIAIPWTSMGECSARQVAETDADGDGTFVAPKDGFNATVVPASEGRPFFLGLTDDYEDWYVTYVGTYFTKSYALQLLSYNYAYFPRVDAEADPRVYDVSWYRLFPKEVSKLYHAFATDHAADIGPMIAPDGSYVARELLGPDGLEPDYTGNTRVLPSVSFNHQYGALLWPNIYNSGTDDTFDFPKTMQLALEGGDDDTVAFQTAIDRVTNDADPNSNAEDVVATFVHPISGLTLRGLKVGEFPVAYDVIGRLNILKDRFEQLDACVTEMDDGDDTTNLHTANSYCHCVTVDTNTLTGDCEEMRIEPVGEGLCVEFSLRNRRDSSREIMDDLVDYAGDLRSLNKSFGWY